VAAQSIAASEIAENSIGSAGVRMVESVPILDTSEQKYKIPRKRLDKPIELLSANESRKTDQVSMFICVICGLLFLNSFLCLRLSREVAFSHCSLYHNYSINH
jgi:hypothetical protein